MSSNIKRKAAVAVTALAATAVAGGAYAATQESSAGGRQAFLSDVAKRLHVTPAQVHDAIKGAAVDQLNAAVADGKLTQAQANALKQRIQQGGGSAPFPVPFAGAPGAWRGGLRFRHRGPHFWPVAPGTPPATRAIPAPGGGPIPGPPGAPRFRAARPGPFEAAAKYLGLTGAQLFKDLSSGKSLADIAKSEGKSVAGLKAAIIAQLTANVDKAVTAKRPAGPPRLRQFGP